jgi:hypothetical protein
MSAEHKKKLERLFKSSIKKKDLETFQQAYSLNDALDYLVPAQDVATMVASLFKAKTAAGWKVALSFNDILDDYLKVSEASITKLYMPIVGKMSWNSTPEHLKEEWWKEVGTRIATFTSKKQKKSLKEALPHVDSKGLVLDWGGIMISERYNPDTGDYQVVERKPYTQVLNVFYENGKIETVSEDIGLKKGSSNITLDQTASDIAKAFIQTYNFIN